MLSAEQRLTRETRMKNGMVNWTRVVGFAKGVTSRGGFIAQTANGNHRVSWELQARTKMPSWLKDGVPVRLEGRIEGKREEETGDQTAVFRVLAINRPNVVEMPPAELFEGEIHPDAPSSDVVPKKGQSGLKMDMRRRLYNEVSIAGIITSMKLRRAGVVQADGKQSNACLYMHVQQADDPTKSVQVRIYGFSASKVESALTVGAAVSIKRGSLFVDVKQKDEPVGEDGVAPVTTVQYVRAEMEGVVPAVPDVDIKVPLPVWAVEFRKKAREDRATRLKEKMAERDRVEALRRVQQGLEPAGGGDLEVVAADVGTATMASTQATASAEPERTLSAGELMALVAENKRREGVPGQT